MKKQAVTINLAPEEMHTLTLLASAKGISVATEIESIIAQHFARPPLIGMPDLVGTEVQGSALQPDGLVKLNGVLYFYQLVGTKRIAQQSYVVAEVSEQKVYLVTKGEYHAGN
ncbi:hypothetical protein B808_131 [Fructilactobacillus florum 8D]|uniref:Uncharacterized protein n=2 Tax=Fructilactobacillus florum TaxID=640331 RepID=W9EIA0_9LACO|nr:hypothetical protein B807_443 [Fructilactobacillus florum 2F]ETO40976.1 hypothetical protein B808_131 [Fructilactobacillus florum 8D]